MRRRVVGAVVLAALVAGGGVGWRWYQERTEREQALQLVADRHFDAAEPLLLRAHERHPQDVDPVRALAVGYLEARRPGEAETFLNRWCLLQPQAAEPYRRRLELWMRQQKLPLATADAQAVLELEPEDYQTRRMLAQLLLVAGRYPEAEQEGRRCLQAQPNNLTLWHLLASAYRGQGRTAEAAEVLDRALRLKPDFRAALQLRGELDLEAGRPESAIPLLRQAAAGPGPEATAALYPLSLALDRAGRADEARRVAAELQWRLAFDLWAADEHRDDSPGLQARVVEPMLAAGKAEEAVRFLTGILERKPRAAGTRQLLADCYDKMGQPQRAEEERRKAGGWP
jgi:predicted Zn-dependent protease